MRKMFILTMLLAAVAFATTSEVVTFSNNWGKNPMFSISQTSDAGVDIIFSAHKMVVEEMEIDGKPMKSYSVPGIFLNNDEGAPNLGGTGRYIAIPQGATARVTIIDVRTEVYRNIEVAPAPNIPFDNDDSPLRYVKNNNIYSKNEYYPDSPVKLSEPMQMRGVDCVILGITPFQYNPITKDLIVYKDIRVRIDFIGGNGHFGDDALRNIFWEPILQGHLLNYSSLPQIDFFAPERIKGRDGYEYIIIVPDDPIFQAWGDTIKNWRKLQGISTQVYTLTQVGGNTITAIKNFMTTAYNTWNPRPVAFLLLSDYENSGKTYGITSRSLTHPYSGTYVMDNYYADMNNDNLPDMLHARICAKNESQLSIMINKFLSYERSPYTDPIFYNQPIIAAAWQTERWFQLCGEVVRGFMANSTNGLGKNPNRQYAIYSGTPTVGGSWSTATNTSTVVNYFYNLGWLPSTTQPNNSTWWNNGSASAISAGINAGAFLLQHRDHGLETGWGEPAYSNSNVNGLTNDKYIFVNSTNCLTGEYNWSSECFVEAFHRSQHGAVGSNAPSQVSYSFVNDAYIWGWYDCMWQKFMPDYPSYDLTPYSTLLPCAAMNYGKYFLQASSWPYNTGDKLVTLNLFHHHGDVFNTLNTEMPQNLTVVHVPTMIAGTSTFTVTANDSSIIALTANGEILGVARGTGNPVAITITPQIPGTNVIVTVTKPNYYRYMTTVPVVSSSYPYVIASRTTVNDSGANGQINPGELIDYEVWAQNIGIGTAQGIYGKLRTTNSYVMMLRDSVWFGTIPANDSVLSNPNYRFRISNNCPNNQTMNFTIEYHDINDSIFRSYRVLRVYAPILTYQSVSVLGGNNNGVLNLGETANLVVTLNNSGGADAANVSAVLLTDNLHITINDPNGSFGTITPNNNATNISDQFTVTADSSITPGTTVQFSIVVISGVYCDTLQFNLPVEIYLADFENNNGSYIADPLISGWEWGVPTSGPNSPHSGTKLWATNLGGDYLNSANWKLTSEAFTTTTDNPTLKFWHWYNMELSSSYPGRAYDGGNVKISVNSGPWTLIRPVGGYNAVGYTTNAGIPGESCYSGVNETWTEVVFNLPLIAGQQFLVRWHFGSDAAVQKVGWYIDDVTGIGFTKTFSGVAEEINSFKKPATKLNVSKPNPVTNGLAHISFTIAETKRVSLKIYDASGRIIRNLVNELMSSGVYDIVWNGKDDNNRAVAEGIYFYTLGTPEQKLTQKLIFTR